MVQDTGAHLHVSDREAKEAFPEAGGAGLPGGQRTPNPLPGSTSCPLSLTQQASTRSSFCGIKARSVDRQEPAENLRP